MPDDATVDLDQLPVGVEPGLRFACVLDGRGGCREASWADVERWRPEDGVMWIHLERDTPEAARWMRTHSGLDPLLVESLLAPDSRPRADACDSGMLWIMRGVDLTAGDALQLVPLHVWVDDHRVISLRDKHQALSALKDIRKALHVGRGPSRPGALVVAIADKINRDLEPAIDRMDVDLEVLEDELLACPTEHLRNRLTQIRRSAIHVRRYIGPKREALLRALTEKSEVLDRRDRLKLRAAADDVSRFIDDLDEIRDRASLLHQDLAAQMQATVARNSNRFAVLAALFMPPSLIAGMLGANIGGIPGQDNTEAFIGLVAIVVAILGFQYFLLRRLRWL